jgi:hypothetical protein
LQSIFAAGAMSGTGTATAQDTVMIQAFLLQAGVLLTAIAAMAPPLHGESVAELWNSPSQLTPAQACEVLSREADGEIVAPKELFEAEKYLRTDGDVSLSLYVATKVLARFLLPRVHDGSGDVRLRSFPPVLQWLESRAGSNGLRLRGESVQVAVLNAGANRAATILYHQTILQDWGICDGSLCFTCISGALRENAAYELSTSTASATPSEARSSDLILATDLAGWLHSGAEPTGGNRGGARGACDPMVTEVVSSGFPRPTISLRHRVGETSAGEPNRILCGFFARRSDARVRFTYLISDMIAAPPVSASRSAIRNNPLDFTLFEPARRQ